MKKLMSLVLIFDCLICLPAFADTVLMPTEGSYDLSFIPPLDTSLLGQERKTREKDQEATLKKIVSDVIDTKKNGKKRSLKTSKQKQATSAKAAFTSFLAGTLQKKTAIEGEVEAMMYEQFQDPELAQTTISLHLKQIPTRDALGLISKTSGIHMVIDGDVTGMVQDVRLDNIPLAAALHSVLGSNEPRLALIKEFGVWRVSKAATVRDVFAGIVARDHEKDFTTTVLTVEHTQWNDALKVRIEKLWLGITGRSAEKASLYMVLDDVNKKIFVRARSADVHDFTQAIKALDVSIPQIRIDARVVIAEKNFEEVLGFNWSGLYDRSASLKHFDFAGVGPNQPGPNGPDGTPLYQNLIGWSLNLLPSMATSTIKVPFVFGNKDMTTKRLNLELNAAENRSEIKTILKPSLLVHNTEDAEILVGEELPNQVRLDEAIEGKLTNVTTVNYKDIGMKIKVKPVVAPDLKSVFLDVFVENSVVTKPTVDPTTGVGTVGTSSSLFNYTIQTSRSKNRVLLRSGQTTMIGGLVTEAKQKEKNGVPYLKDIPLLGLLFQGSHKKLVDKQLLIFITPTLVDVGNA